MSEKASVVVVLLALPKVSANFTHRKVWKLTSKAEFHFIIF